ncbi:MAG: hypothetical protein WCK63_00015 [Betaproteobacteria bacterium]
MEKITVLPQHPTPLDSQALFDEHGRRLPGPVAMANQKTRRHFICSQPDINYADIHARISTGLDRDCSLSAAGFEQRAEAILDRLRADPALRNILNGAHVPFFLPQAIHQDIGKALDEQYLPAVQRSFQSRFPDYAFVNHHKGGLEGKLSIANGSRHDQLLQAMNEGVVVGHYFPCLLEYSVPAAIEQLQNIPGEILLAGGFDTCAAFVGSPELLLKSHDYPPLLWLAALKGEREDIGYHFEAYGYNLTFNRRAHLGQVAEYWASGLVVLG